MPTVYLPYAQLPIAFMTVLTQTSTERLALLNLRSAVRTIDPGLPLGETSMLPDVAAAAAAEPRLRTWLVTAIAVAALLLAIVGVYGLLSDAIAQRVREMGIRQALGAEPKSLHRLVVGEGLRLTI